MPTQAELDAQSKARAAGRSYASAPGVTRSSEPAPRDPKAAARSAGGAGRADRAGDVVDHHLGAPGPRD